MGETKLNEACVLVQRFLTRRFPITAQTFSREAQTLLAVFSSEVVPLDLLTVLDEFLALKKRVEHENELCAAFGLEMSDEVQSTVRQLTVLLRDYTAARHKFELLHESARSRGKRYRPRTHDEKKREDALVDSFYSPEKKPPPPPPTRSVSFSTEPPQEFGAAARSSSSSSSSSSRRRKPNAPQQYLSPAKRGGLRRGSTRSSPISRGGGGLSGRSGGGPGDRSGGGPVSRSGGGLDGRNGGGLGGRSGGGLGGGHSDGGGVSELDSLDLASADQNHSHDSAANDEHKHDSVAEEGAARSRKRRKVAPRKRSAADAEHAPASKVDEEAFNRLIMENVNLAERIASAINENQPLPLPPPPPPLPESELSGPQKQKAPSENSPFVSESKRGASQAHREDGNDEKTQEEEVTMAMSLAEILAQMPDAPEIADEEFESHEVDSNVLDSVFTSLRSDDQTKRSLQTLTALDSSDTYFPPDEPLPADTSRKSTSSSSSSSGSKSSKHAASKPSARSQAPSRERGSPTRPADRVANQAVDHVADRVANQAANRATNPVSLESAPTNRTSKSEDKRRRRSRSDGRGSGEPSAIASTKRRKHVGSSRHHSRSPNPETPRKPVSKKASLKLVSKKASASKKSHASIASSHSSAQAPHVSPPFVARKAAIRHPLFANTRRASSRVAADTSSSSSSAANTSSPSSLAANATSSRVAANTSSTSSSASSTTSSSSSASSTSRSQLHGSSKRAGSTGARLSIPVPEVNSVFSDGFLSDAEVGSFLDAVHDEDGNEADESETGRPPSEGAHEADTGRPPSEGAHEAENGRAPPSEGAHEAGAVAGASETGGPPSEGASESGDEAGASEAGRAPSEGAHEANDVVGASEAGREPTQGVDDTEGEVGAPKAKRTPSGGATEVSSSLPHASDVSVTQSPSENNVTSGAALQNTEPVQNLQSGHGSTSTSREAPPRSHSTSPARVTQGSHGVFTTSDVVKSEHPPRVVDGDVSEFTTHLAERTDHADPPIKVEKSSDAVSRGAADEEPGDADEGYTSDSSIEVLEMSDDSDR